MKTIQEHEPQRAKPDTARMNVGTAERVGSAIGGGALVAYGLSRRSVGGALLALLGGAALYRGVTGSCPAYTSLGITTAADDRPLEEQLKERGISIEKTITINRPPEELYASWRSLPALPGVMGGLAPDGRTGGEGSRRLAEETAGSRAQWESMITEEKQNELIGWRSLPDADVESVGSVRFIPCNGGMGTEVKVALSYSPPAGRAGDAVAKLFGKDPSRRLGEDLRRFQQKMETGDIVSAGQRVSGNTGSDAGNEDARRFAWGSRDSVEEASWESFPASDPPAW